jgi:SAM-dependent methyltransferase
MDNYNVIAQKYALERSTSAIGLPELEALLNTLPKGASILDFGCGTGKPISAAIVQHPHQFRLFGVDSSSEMVGIFSANLPNVPVECASILAFDFFSMTFDAVVSWGVMFHLNEEEQLIAIEKIAKALRRGGYFLFTSGKEAGMRHGRMFEIDFDYYSLGAEAYRQALSNHGLTVVDEHFDTGENYYYLARKTVEADYSRR